LNPQHLELLSGRSDLYPHRITLAFTQHGPAQRGFTADDLNGLSAADQLHAASIRPEKELLLLVVGIDQADQNSVRVMCSNNMSNLKSQFLCCRAVVPGMVRRQYGRIVNLSSRAWLGSFGQASYAAAKGEWSASRAVWPSSWPRIRSR
jgi:hypothetical protein